MCSRKDEEVPGEENGEGEALVVPEWPGQWRRLRLLEMRKEASPGRWAANGGPREMAWDCLRAEMSSGLLKWASQGGSAAAADKVAGDRHSVARASWRRRALVDTLVDELALFQGAGGERERLGRH